MTFNHVRFKVITYHLLYNLSTVEVGVCLDFQTSVLCITERISVEFLVLAAALIVEVKTM